MTRLWAIAAAAAAGGASCSRAPSDLAWCVPPGAGAVAVVRLDRVRSVPAASPLLDLLPAGLLRQASSALAAYDGREWTVAARGSFPSAPAGALLVARDVVLFGPPAAAAQFRTGRSGAPHLLASEKDSGAADVHLALSGDAQLPLPGNAANVNRLLRMSRTAMIDLRLGDTVGIDARATCRDPAAAEELRQTVGAMLLFAGPGRQSETRLSRDGNGVRLTAAVPAADLARLLSR